MMSHPHDDIEAFALGSLDEASGRRVLEHADQCPTCAVLLADAVSVAHAMEPGGERTLTSPIGLAGSLQRRAAFGDRTARQPWRMLQVATIAAVVLTVVWSIDLLRGVLLSNHVTVPVAALVHSHFTHHALQGEGGHVKVLQSLDGRWVYLVADGLRPKARYVLSETIGGTRRDVGQFVSTTSGEATAYWEQAPGRIERLQVIPVDKPSTVLRWP